MDAGTSCRRAYTVTHPKNMRPLLILVHIGKGNMMHWLKRFPCILTSGWSRRPAALSLLFLVDSYRPGDGYVF